MFLRFSCGSIDSCFGAVRSPWQGTDTDDDDWHIAGGSSGGSACAVATGTVMAYVLVILELKLLLQIINYK